MADADDYRFMAQALRIAARGRYTTQPNPQVGCLVVRDGQVVGSGWHVAAGQPHAEVLALEAAGSDAAGATVYSTLEPCNHHGRTPPCTQALLKAGVARVVCGSLDPNPAAAGGLQWLAARGISAEAGVLAMQSEALNRGFYSRIRRGRPWVRLKVAVSLDGRTAMADGESQWISGEAARRDVQRLRAQACAILTGVGTVLADDPRLDVRLAAAELGAAGEVRQPLRVILDSSLRTPITARVLAPPGRVLILTGPAHATESYPPGVEIRSLNPQGRPELRDVMGTLAGMQVGLVHVECGQTLAGALIEAGLVDELVLYLAPHLMGSQARALACLPSLKRMAQRLQWRLTEQRRVGADLRITAVPARVEVHP